MKRKGSNAERELMHKLWKQGFAVVRAAGSGSTTLPNPDLFASINGKNYAIECKCTKNTFVRLKEEQLKNLIIFSKRAKAKPIIAVKFLNNGWKFFEANKLVLKYEEGIKSFYQKKLI